MFTSVILAAGMGTRMKSKMPKVLHKVCGKPLSKWVIDASEAAGADKVCAVVGHKAETVKEVLGDVCCRLNKRVQVTQLCKLSTL